MRKAGTNFNKYSTVDFVTFTLTIIPRTKFTLIIHNPQKREKEINNNRELKNLFFKKESKNFF